MTRLIVGPFNRVEGDLEVTLEMADGRVQSAQVNSPMYRGFEQILQGKDPHDALVYVPRICGICSVSQTVVASAALADLAQVSPMPNGQIATNLTLATENMADHLTHFYMFFMPDFTRPIYGAQPWHASAEKRFSAQTGAHIRTALAARQRWMTLMGTLAGKWPHTQSIDPGGSSRAIEPTEQIRMLAKVREFRQFLEAQVFAAPLELITSLPNEAALWQWFAQVNPTDVCGGDLRLFLHLVQTLAIDKLGPGPGRYLSFGAYPQPGGPTALGAGVWDGALHQLRAVDASQIQEDLSHAWLQGASEHPFHGVTQPDADKAGAYTWNKAPRLGGQVIETGAIARQLASSQPLIRDAVANHGGTVYTRVLARLVELATVVPMMEQWFGQLRKGEAYCQPVQLPDTGMGSGLGEAARGALGHWVVVRNGKIANYQIIAPTSWNFSPRDANGMPGALEQALVNAPIQPGEATPVAVQHIVRSFDPCMVCTVH